MHSHLVTVKVGVESRTNQWMQLDGLAFDQDGLKRLDAQTVQRRRTVQHDRVFFDHLFEDVPNHGCARFDFFLGSLDGGRNTHSFQARKDERLEQLQSHQFRQAALVQLERWTHRNHGTTGVIHALAQQVLAETTRLTLDHVGQGLQSTLVGTRHGLAATAIVQQAVHGFLQHALFVARNDLRCLQLQQAAQTAVAVDHTTVQIVQVGGREAATVQWHQRTQIRRQHRQHVQHHPLRLDAGFLERFQDLQTLGVLLDL